MGAEAAAALAEIAARLRHLKIRDTIGCVLDGDVGEPGHLSRLLALVADLLVDDHDDVACRALRILGEFGDRHFGIGNAVWLPLNGDISSRPISG